MTKHSTDSGNRGSRPDWIVRVVWAVQAVHAGLLAWGAWIHSPGWDEWGHLPPGISHWHLGQFDLYRVNPPPVRMVAAAPVLFCGPEIEWPGMSGPRGRPLGVWSGRTANACSGGSRWPAGHASLSVYWALGSAFVGRAICTALLPG